MTTATPVQGKILQVFGPVVDVQFPEGQVPNLYNAITVVDRQRGIDLVLEVAQQLGNASVRCVSMSSTDGMSRGMVATDTGAAISVPVGDATPRSPVRRARPRARGQRAAPRAPACRCCRCRPR